MEHFFESEGISDAEFEELSQSQSQPQPQSEAQPSNGSEYVPDQESEQDSENGPLDSQVHCKILSVFKIYCVNIAITAN